MEVQKEYLVVGYFNGKAIITDEWKHVYYIVCSCNEAPIGTVVEEKSLSPISELEQTEREKIERLF